MVACWPAEQVDVDVGGPWSWYPIVSLAVVSQQHASRGGSRFAAVEVRLRRLTKGQGGAVMGPSERAETDHCHRRAECL